MKDNMKAALVAHAIRQNDTLGRMGVVATKINGVTMVDARMAEEVIENAMKAYRSLVAAIEREFYEVIVDVDGTHSVVKKH